MSVSASSPPPYPLLIAGLDARAAAIVMRVIKNVAASGRTVVCTVHQPSAELFFLFDDLLLLTRGGYQAYFGPLGARGRDMVKYLSSVPGIPAYPEGMNPASYMLDAMQGMSSSAAASTVVSAPPSTASDAALSAAAPSGLEMQEHYFTSRAWDAASAALKAHAAPKTDALKLSFSSRYAASFAVQCAEVTKRQFAAHWRNVPLNFARWVAMTFLSLLFGTIWYDIYSKATDVGGVQSLVAGIFMTVAFLA